MAKILIVDDDQDLVDSLTMILESHGNKVAVKNNTENIEEKIISENPDLIILDIIFPEDSQAGFKLARLIKGNEKLKKIPILIFSAVNQRSNMAFTFSEEDISQDFMPVEGFLEKPVEPKALLDKINLVLKLSGEA